MASAMVASSNDDQLPTPPPAKSGGGSALKRGGFFSIYKRGQGTVTRLSTGIAAALLLVVVGVWAGQQSRPFVSNALQPANSREVANVMSRNIAFGIGAAIIVVGAALVWKLMNSPRGAEFLITTDSEMKKVNWASRKEVFGSTRVVVIFLFFIATFLFVADIFFSWFFHLIGVLRAGPFG